MPAPFFARLRRSLERFVSPYQNSKIDDDLLRHLVATVYCDRASRYSSTAFSLALTATAWIVTRSTAFAVLTLLHLPIGFARLSLFHRYIKAGGERASRATTLAFDRDFSFWSAAYALTLGVTFYLAVASGERDILSPLAIGGAVGYPLAFANSHAGRPRMLLYQMLAVLTPVAYGYLTLPIAHGGYLAALVVCMGGAGFVLGRSGYARLAAHFKSNETNRHLARFDTLTGLLNRYSFNDALEHALGGAHARRIALFTVDLDRFKEINDTEGHAVGDAVIAATAARLRRATRPEDIVARLGGDEFVVLARCGGGERGGAADFADAIVAALAQPVELPNVTLSVTASVGAAIFPDHCFEATELMKCSDIALYEAKRGGRGRYSVFDSSMQTRLDIARLLELEIERAIREDQFEAWFQPIHDIESGRTLGYEALARWRHPLRGVMPPDSFISLAEQSGAIVGIGRTILEKACRAAADWDSDLTVAVNLSPVEFRRSAELVRNIADTLSRTRLDPSRLFIEITESLMLEDCPETRAAINQLSGMGVRFALDDFGAGYSSLSYIQDYPFSKIKIDRKFVERIDSDAVSAAIIASVCVLAERTRMDIIAEGVETRNQEQALRRLGIKHAQGYLYGRPGPNRLPAAAKLRLAASR